MDSHDSQDGKQSPADMTAFVQNLLQQMQGRFQTMSDSIITKIDDMGSRIEELEQSINELRAEIGVELSQLQGTPEKPKEDESNKEEGSS
ncbi:heat shock factor-binding protein-like [Vicia villosa]|uniref:heat shock factor-binding protein-like n=1 Tax=Vicia villosa TaxID=3911 RepID=UPI00273AC9CF|nr:heat shock factor-binding protein-like [Vicia villosa]